MTRRLCTKIVNSVISSGFLDSFDYVLTDCDGVLWMLNEPLPGSAKTIHTLKEKGKKIIYVTNNCTKSREDYLQKFKALGFPANLENIFPASYCAAAYLKNMHFQKKVYVLGSTGITKELQNANITHLPIGPDLFSDYIPNPTPDKLDLDPEVGAVIVGFDFNLSYVKLVKAASYLKNPEILFLSTAIDDRIPLGDDIVIPATYPIIKAVEVASGRKSLSLGKPGKFVLDCIKQKHHDIDLSRCIMIGDKLHTDILFGNQHGIRTLFVLSGIDTLEDVKKHQNSSDSESHMLIPDYYLPSLGDLMQFL